MKVAIKRKGKMINITHILGLAIGSNFISDYTEDDKKRHIELIKNGKGISEVRELYDLLVNIDNQINDSGILVKVNKIQYKNDKSCN